MFCKGDAAQEMAAHYREQTVSCLGQAKPRSSGFAVR